MEFTFPIFLGNEGSTLVIMLSSFASEFETISERELITEDIFPRRLLMTRALFTCALLAFSAFI